MPHVSFARVLYVENSSTPSVLPAATLLSSAFQKDGLIDVRSILRRAMENPVSMIMKTIPAKQIRLSILKTWENLELLNSSISQKVMSRSQILSRWCMNVRPGGGVCVP